MNRPPPRRFTPNIVGRAFAHGTVLVVAQKLKNFDVPPPPAGVVIEPFTGRDWRALTPIASESQLRRFERRAQLGRVCLVARDYGRPVGYGWISPVVETGIEGFALDLPVGACYGWDLYVEPGSRRRGLGAALTGAGLLWAEADGYTAIWRLVAPHNAAALRTVEHAGSDQTEFVGELRYVRLLRWFRGSFGPISPASKALSRPAPRNGAAA
jgi:ribosomal protein S18 acetylase RimI-like enzyme